MRRAPTRLLLPMLACLVSAACSDAGTSEPCLAPAPEPAPDLSVYHDPGVEAWETVAREDLVERCGLDPEILDSIDSATTYPYAIARYGLLCHEHYPDGQPGPDDVAENFSATKTLAATVVGRAATISAGLDAPLCDTDRMDAWIDDITFNPDALVAHVLAMVGYNESLEFGERVYKYDAAGNREINRLGDVIESVMAQDPLAFGGATTTGDLAQLELFDRLGMTSSAWTGEIFGYSWQSNLRDMARLGVLLVHEGVWGGERLVHEEWVYRMTHPALEDSNTAYGYLTWLASHRNYYLPGFEDPIMGPIGGCQPSAIWTAYPHPPSESLDCNYDGVVSCEQTHDVGVFAAVGFGGQLVVGHPGLDLVVVAKNAGDVAFVMTPWDLIRAALIEHDPVYAGDQAAFCAAYAAGDHAPDLITLP